MKILTTKPLSESFKKQVYQLWNKEYPKRLSYSNLSEFEDYLLKLEDLSHLLLMDVQGKVKGWYFDFIRENERWFGMILDSSVQGLGWGTKILNLAKQKNSVLNGWVIDHDRDIKQDGAPYLSPLPFYIKNEFKVLPSERLELDHISAVKIMWNKSSSSGISN